MTVDGSNYSKLKAYSRHEKRFNSKYKHCRSKERFGILLQQMFFTNMEFHPVIRQISSGSKKFIDVLHDVEVVN